MTELSHSDAQAHEIKDFEYSFYWEKQVLLILKLKKCDACLKFVNKWILLKMCIFCNGPIVSNWSLFPNRKSDRVGQIVEFEYIFKLWAFILNLNAFFISNILGNSTFYFATVIGLFSRKFYLVFSESSWLSRKEKDY